ncbi:MAG: hypothetical protein Q4E36_01600 [Bacillota bacterium]|nr:hypothetical protein [Bacillota bacterium]
MKKILILFLLVFSLVACKKEEGPVMEEPKTNESQENQEAGEIPSALPPMVRVDDRVYISTAYVNSLVTCGTADGEITSTVESNQSLEKNDQGNFGLGYEYQFWEDPYLNVKIDGEWIIFMDMAIDARSIPPMVAHFTAKVIETDQASLLVQPSEIPEEFHLKDLNKPVRLEIDNLDYSENGHVTTKGLEGKSLEVYFDGRINNAEPESSIPASLGQIYKIEVLD